MWHKKCMGEVIYSSTKFYQELDELGEFIPGTKIPALICTKCGKEIENQKELGIEEEQLNLFDPEETV